MALDVKLRQIVSKQAGIYFIVTDKSQIADIEEEPKLRLFPINTEEGPVNCLLKFSTGDISGFRSVFGKATRSKEKKGNFSHKVCEDALSSGPIGVINLRNFDNERDVTNIATINPNTVLNSSVRTNKIPYVELFDRNGFWSVKPSLITEKYYQNNGYLNFANVGSNNVSILVTKSTDQEVAMITSEYDKTLETTDLEIDEYPGLNWNTKVKDTFVNVYIFKNDFKNANTNPYYGYLFDSNDNIKYGSIEELTNIKESGFYAKYTGSVIPNLKSENEENISIDTLIYNDYAGSGVVCDINADLLEYELSVINEDNTNGYIDLFGFDAVDEFNLLSYIAIDKTESANIVDYSQNRYDSINVKEDTLTKFKCSQVQDDSLSFVIQGTDNIKIGDYIKCKDGYGVVESIELNGNEDIVEKEDIASSVASVAYGNGKYLAFCSKDENNPWRIFSTSNDGTSWKMLNTGYEDYTFLKSYFANNQIISFVKKIEGEETSYVLLYSENDKMKEGGSIETSHTYKDIIFGNDIFLTLCDDCYMYFATPKNNPTVVPYDGLEYTNGCFCNNNFYVVGNDGKLYFSNNARQWSEFVAKNSSDDSVISNISHCASYNNRVYIVDGEKLYKMNLNGTFDEVSTTSTIPVTGDFMRITNGNVIFTNNSVAGATASDILNNKVFAVKSDGTFLLKVMDSSLSFGTNKIKENYQFDKSTYKYIVSRSILFGESSDSHYIVKYNPPLYNENQICRFFALESYKPVEEQFTNGTAKRQKEILDMMNDPSITRGIKGTAGARYIIDCFKSYVENNYKYQFGKLAKKLDENNKFVRCIINEPFTTDLDKSVNPLYKQTPNGILDYSYLPEGGNKQYTTQLVDKFTEGSEMCFFFGPGDRINGIIKPLSGIISNLFYSKSLAFDVVANTTGYLTGVTELETKFDDEDRKYLEKFRYNPVIDFGGITIFGNLTGQKQRSKQQQIHNSELLCYIKENLYTMAKSEVFTKGTYDNYLRTQTETQNFMDSLALAGAVKANPKVVCDATNNTDEVSRYKIKLVHVEYEPIDCLEKVVFDLNIL